MFKHTHPYPPFIPEKANKLIVGTLPPPRFTTGELKPFDVDFCYGSQDGQLWEILCRIFKEDLIKENSQKEIQRRKKILINHNIGICDIVAVGYREKIDASDMGIKNPEFRPILPILKKFPLIKTLLFMGGNSKNGPEYLFRKYLKDFPEIQLKEINATVPREHQFSIGNRIIKTVSLTAPSGSANRAIGSMEAYKILKDKHPEMTTIDFRILQYEKYFLE